MRPAVVQDTVEAEGFGCRGVVKSISNNEHLGSIHRSRKAGRHGPQVLVQVGLFAIARLPPQPVDPDQDLTKAEAFDLRNQFIDNRDWLSPA